MMNDIIKTILERRSVRSYLKIAPPDSDINMILECGKYSPTALGMQPWFFTVVKNKALLDEMTEDVKAIRSANGETVPDDFKCFRGAPVAIIVSRDAIAPFGEIDCANAVTNMAVAATSLGIASCYVASFRPAVFSEEKRDYYAEKLKLPDGFIPCLGLALGYTTAPFPPRKDREPNRISVVE